MSVMCIHLTQLICCHFKLVQHRNQTMEMVGVEKMRLCVRMDSAYAENIVVTGNRTVPMDLMSLQIAVSFNA